MQNSMSFNEKLGFMKQTRGFSTKAIHAGFKPEQLKSRFGEKSLLVHNICEYFILELSSLPLSLQPPMLEATIQLIQMQVPITSTVAMVIQLETFSIKL